MGNFDQVPDKIVNRKLTFLCTAKNLFNVKTEAFF